MRIPVLIHVSINIEYESDTSKRNRLLAYLVNSLLPPIPIPILAEKACPNFEQLLAVAPGRYNELRTHVGCGDTRAPTLLSIKLTIGRCNWCELESAGKLHGSSGAKFDLEKSRLSLAPLAY